MMFKQVAIAAALVVGAVSAQANTAARPGQNLGVLGTQSELFGDVKYSAGSFTDTYNFSLDSLSSVSGSLAPIFFGPMSFSQVKVNGVSGALTSTNTGYSFSFDNLAAGSYTLSVLGFVPTIPRMYVGSIMAQPVPEPQSIAMLLAGLGLMGAVVARRRKTH